MIAKRSALSGVTATVELHGIRIVDTFAEAFPMTATRVVITAATAAWAEAAATAMTGLATSVIGCGAEAAVERMLSESETPDGRPGVAVLVFAMSGKELEKQITRRVGQCVLTCPTTAAFSGMDAEKRIALGSALRYFGDGFQISKLIGGRRYWRIPVMDGEFLCEEDTGRCPAVGGGNFLVLARSIDGAARACAAAVAEIGGLGGVITPFPGGATRSGSKVGSKYASLPASTNEAFCPTLRPLVESALPPEAGAALEVVIDGLSEEDVRRAIRVGIHAACEAGRDAGVVQITAGNYGGRLGKHHFPLHEVLS